MDFEFTEDQLELQRTIRDVLDKECPPAVARRLAEEEGSVNADALWKTMVALDWPALALDESVGGLGFTWVEQAILVEELGRHVAPGPYLATLTQFAPAVSEVGSAGEVERFLGPVAGGDATGALAVDEGSGTWALDAIEATAAIEGDDIALAGNKRFVVDGQTADEIAVVVRLDGELRLVVAPADAVTATPIDPVDATTRHADVSLDGVRVGRDRLLGDGDATDGLTRALEGATLAVALSTIGASASVFERTKEYVGEREQFDVPIGSFQAVKHKLVDMYRDLERATALAYFAALCLAEDDQRRTIACAMAKASAGECQRRVFEDGLQLHGGIGYTWENDLHLFMRRAKVGELHFGSAAQHRRRVAEITLSEIASPDEETT